MSFDKKTIKTIQKALKVLGKKNFALIVHNASFPAAKGENTGFGSVNTNGGKALIDYASGLFNAIQLGPAGKTKGCDSSHYTGTIFSTNPLLVDIKALTTKKWDNILSIETYNEIVENNPKKDENRTAYSYAYKKYADALDEAFKNFIEKGDKKLKKEFEEYKSVNNRWLDKDSIYEALSIENRNDYWPLWESDIDKNLFSPTTIEERLTNGERLVEISKKYEYDIDKYKFIQFVLSKQSEETREYAKSKDIKMIADRQVAFSDRDIWAYKSLFLDGWMLGCPPDYFSKDGQAWGFPVLDPERMYKEDGSLDKGGMLLKNLYKKMFRENPGGVRIDHIVGLIDPWVYKAGKKPKIEEGAGRLYSSPEHPFLNKFAIATMDDLDTTLEADKEKRVKTLTDKQIELYGRLIEKIVIAAAEEEGLDKNAIVCEDLGTLTNPVAAVMKKYQLQGMRLTQFVVPEEAEHPYRCCNIDECTWAMVGTHDNEPISMWAKSMVNTHKGYLHVKNLVEDLYTEADNKDELITCLTKDVDYLKFVKLVELFASKAENIQMFFTDFFQIEDVYNRPGTSGDANWSLRIPDNFEELTPIDLPEILKQAIISRGSEFAKKNEKLIEELSEI
ncbi:4-alpha-glucanotransferase [bacterium]|nr:4-alpha-glucanotransferase [bacterium]